MNFFFGSFSRLHLQLSHDQLIHWFVSSSHQTSMAEGKQSETLVNIFTTSLSNVSLIDTTDDPLSSTNVQKKVKETIKSLEELTTHLNELSVFSSNEVIDEVATSNIRFLLVPALLGYLTSKRIVPIDERFSLLEQCEIYYKDYLKRLREYSVISRSVHLKSSDDDESNEKGTDDSIGKITSREISLEEAAASRDGKIARFKAKKELEEREAYIRKQIDEGIGDDEIHRNYYLCLLKKWVAIVEDEMDSLLLEKQVLKHRPSGGFTSSSSSSSSSKEKGKSEKKPFKPFIITKNAATKAVFGAGYPSMPVMSVDEFVDQKISDGTWAITAQKDTVYKNSLQQWATDPMSKEREDEKYEEEKEKLAEKEDENEIKRLREWDDFKDNTKRGEGNRMNMS